MKEIAKTKNEQYQIKKDQKSY